jgi:chemotaxis protein methyltransferase CheR
VRQTEDVHVATSSALRSRPSAFDDAASDARGPLVEHEFRFTPADFERVQHLIHQRAGIALGASKHNLVYSRLSRRLRACRVASFAAYLDSLERAPASSEWEAFTNALTTNLTSFFREAHHFPMLADHLRCCVGARPMVVWCSASSTGEEPYSIAITACEVFNTLTPPVRIIASDIDTQVLQSAEEGIYPLERVNALGAGRLRKFFERGAGTRNGFARVRAELRALVTYRRINLLGTKWSVPEDLTAIFCRNVLIYFDRPTQRRIVTRFAPQLAVDGLLFAGHSESLTYARDVFRLRGRTVYEKVLESCT